MSERIERQSRYEPRLLTQESPKEELRYCSIPYNAEIVKINVWGRTITFHYNTTNGLRHYAIVIAPFESYSYTYETYASRTILGRQITKIEIAFSEDSE